VGSSPATWLRTTPGELLDIIRHEDRPITKLELAKRTGLSRSAVTQRVSSLLNAGLVIPTRHLAEDTGGRPAERYAVNPNWGVSLIADTGATGMRTAVCDLSGHLLNEHFDWIDITQGPDAILGAISKRFSSHLVSRRLSPGHVRGIGISVPGPVDARTGRVVSPPIMTGWHDYDIPGFFSAQFDCPVTVEKDTNAMVYGAFRSSTAAEQNMVFVKVGTGIGAGLMLSGRLYRGADGAAGDVGHTRLDSAGEVAPACRCNNLGCVEAYAGGWAILRDLQAAGVEVYTIDELVKAVHEGNAEARAMVLESASIIGTAVAHLVNMANPRAVVLGGQLVGLGDLVLATVREQVYRLSLPLATRNLTITTCELPNPGVLGLAALVSDLVLGPDNVDRLLADRRG